MKQIGLLMLAVLVAGVAGCDAGGGGGPSPVIMVEGNGPAYSTEFKESPAPPGPAPRIRRKSPSRSAFHPRVPSSMAPPGAPTRNSR